MDNIESLIWDTITQSAKTKFDYLNFEKKLSSANENTIDGLLFLIINGFAKGESKSEIITHVLQRAMLKKLNWEEFDIIRFVDDKEQLFKVEIYAAHVVHGMLKENNEPATILSTVNKMLN